MNTAYFNYFGIKYIRMSYFFSLFNLYKKILIYQLNHTRNLIIIGDNSKGIL